MSGFDLGHFDRPQALQEGPRSLCLILRICRFHTEKETVLARTLEFRHIEDRMIRLGQAIEHDQRNHCSYCGEKNCGLEGHRNEHGATEVRTATDVDRILDHVNPVLKGESGEPTDDATDETDDGNIGLRKSDRRTQAVYRKRRIGIESPVALAVRLLRGGEQFVAMGNVMRDDDPSKPAVDWVPCTNVGVEMRSADGGWSDELEEALQWVRVCRYERERGRGRGRGGERAATLSAR